MPTDRAGSFDGERKPRRDPSTGIPGSGRDPDGPSTSAIAAGILLAVGVLVGAGYVGITNADGDGLANHREVRGPTDPTNADTDGDGLLDGREVNALGTNPVSTDTDGDGVTDPQEVHLLGSDPARESPRVAALADYLSSGEYSDAEAELLRLAHDNPHGIWQQIQERGVYEDGDVTPDELERMGDPDGDGLITQLEEEIGTPPHETDADGDGLPDGWEHNDYVEIGGNHVPLPGADPLHKDMYLRILPVDGNISEETEKRMATRFAESNVTNPDGERGIDMHISFESGDLEEYEDYVLGEPEEDWYGATHPYWGAYYFMHIMPIEANDTAGYASSPGYNSAVEPSPGYAVPEHELIHNIIGYPDKDIRMEDDPGHAVVPMRITTEEMVEEISRDGILGLPRVSYPNGGTAWNETAWDVR